MITHSMLHQHLFDVRNQFIFCVMIFLLRSTVLIKCFSYKHLNFQRNHSRYILSQQRLQTDWKIRVLCKLFRCIILFVQYLLVRRFLRAWIVALVAKWLFILFFSVSGCLMRRVLCFILVILNWFFEELFNQTSWIIWLDVLLILVYQVLEPKLFFYFIFFCTHLFRWQLIILHLKHTMLAWIEGWFFWIFW